MILLQDVVKGFGDVTALDHVNLEIRKGSIYGLLGPNGAGKSTMLRLICGVYSPDEGAVTLDGNEIFERPEQKQRIFFVSESGRDGEILCGALSELRSQGVRAALRGVPAAQEKAAVGIFQGDEAAGGVFAGAFNEA